MIHSTNLQRKGISRAAEVVFMTAQCVRWRSDHYVLPGVNTCTWTSSFGTESARTYIKFCSDPTLKIFSLSCSAWPSNQLLVESWLCQTSSVQLMRGHIWFCPLLLASTVEPEDSLYLFEFALVILIGNHESQSEVPLHSTSSFTKQRMLRLTYCGFHACRQTVKGKKQKLC